MSMKVDFQTDPSKYRHWKVDYDGDIATLFMDVDEDAGLFEGYELKLNSYDLGVDIELADIVQRMRFEHPNVKVVVLKSAKDGVFCAGANIRMLGGAAHGHKVNFCKFTNETRNTFEAAFKDSGQNYICAIKGACAGGGYELALACNYILLTDDGSSSVGLPEVPLLAVLPGTGGLTRVTDKRKMRRDLADVFCLLEEGVRGKRALDWKLVDEIVPNSKFEETVSERAHELADESSKSGKEVGIDLSPIQREFGPDGSVTYSCIEVVIDRSARTATLIINGPNNSGASSMQDAYSQGAQYYLLRLARELDDAILHLRLNETEIGLWLLKTQGQAQHLIDHENLLLDNQDHWFANEILLYWKRVLKRLDMTSRSLVGVIEHGSCFAGLLAEILFAVDRTYMMDDEFEGDNRPLAAITLSRANFGRFNMSNGLTRLQTRFLDDSEKINSLQTKIGENLDASQANKLGLVTFVFDEFDWHDELRIFLEERASFSPDALTGMEANLRFAGPETMETRVFGRLTAWQNWIFQRPNAVAEEGALQSYGTGKRGKYNMNRV